MFYKTKKSDGSEVCMVEMQRNNFLRLIKVIKTMEILSKPFYKVILYYKSLNLLGKSILFRINVK